MMPGSAATHSLRLGCGIAFSIAAALHAAEPPTTANQEPSRIYEVRADELRTAGVREIDGFVFSTICDRIADESAAREESAARAKASIRAVRQILEWRLSPQLCEGLEHDGLRRAITSVAVSCLEASFDFSGILTVYADVSDGMLTHVCAVPCSRIEPIRMSREQLGACLKSRVAAGTAETTEILVLEELGLDQSTRHTTEQTHLVPGLDAVLGSGMALVRSGRWTDSSGRVDPRSMSGWTGPASSSVARSGMCGSAMMPLSEVAVQDFSINELLSLLVTRVHDPAVRSAVITRLRAAGFLRTASALEGMSAPPLRSLEDRPGRLLAAETRARVFASPLVAALLLSDGNMVASWGAPPSTLPEATTAFDQATPQSIARSIELLVDGMGTIPNADALSLLAAALFASDEPRLAEPLARAAFRSDPAHPFAGANALRAAKALDDRERAAALLPLVSSQTNLGTWARQEIELVSRWLQGQASVTPTSDVAVPPQ